MWRLTFWHWMLVYACFPYLLPLGAFGVFGIVGQRAAWITFQCWIVILLAPVLLAAAVAFGLWLGAT